MQQHGSLLERGEELRLVERALTAAAAGEGSVVAVTGAAGTGRSALLQAIVASARERGARVLIARAGRLELDFGFGVVRQLIEGAVLRADAEERERLLAGSARHAAAVFDLDPGAERERDPGATTHGLYWLLLNLAAEAPVVVVVDDLEWVDEPSLRWLAYVANRVEGAPVVVCVAATTDPVNGQVVLPSTATDARRTAVAALLHGTAVLRLTPGPLSEQATAEVLARALGEPADPAFAALCHERTAGNPLLLAALVAEVADGTDPSAVARVVPGAIEDAVHRQLARLSGDARALATAVAVLGADVTLPMAARLAELDAAAAARAARHLRAIQILVLEPELRFGQPILRDAVEAQVPAPERAQLHARAARVLADHGAPEGRVATHLLASPPGGDAWVVERLCAAARSAHLQGLPEWAGTLLRRALAEPPGPEALPAVLRAAGEAEFDAMHPDAAGHLMAARDATTDPLGRAELALSAAIAFSLSDRNSDGTRTLEAAIEEAGEHPGLRELRLEMEAYLSVVGRYDLATPARTQQRLRSLAARLAGDTPAERLVLAMVADQAPGPSAADRVRATRDVELAEAETSRREPTAGFGIVAMYLMGGRPDLAEATVERRLAKARATGSPLANANAVAMRGLIASDLGDLAAAGADFELAHRTWVELGEQVNQRAGAAFRISVMTAMGDLDAAEALLAECELAGPVPERMYFNPLMHARGELLLARRRFADALADFEELGRRHAVWGITRPTPPWRSGAALALARTGNPERARDLAREQLELARTWDTPKALAEATRTLALLEDDLDGLAVAVALLEDTPFRLERARSRVELGAALRRAGRRRDAREALVIAMDESNRCGAAPLAERAAEELRASGARPRRRAVSGLDALTPSELRVAELAAAGRSNREIAQELFVTPATVETHLSRTYRKLDVAGRSGLADALAAG